MLREGWRPPVAVSTRRSSSHSLSRSAIPLVASLASEFELIAVANFSAILRMRFSFAPPTGLACK
jgi:hypothetical protein